MKMRFTIGKKIGMGFGLFILFALLVVVLTNNTLEKSRTINDEINTVYAPSAEALGELRNLITSSHMLIKHWALVESISDAREKSNLIELSEVQLPMMLDRIDTLSAYWDKNELVALSHVFEQMDVLYGMHGEIRELLPDLESYSNFFIYTERNDMAEEDGPLDQQNTVVLGELDKLIAMQDDKRGKVNGEMIQSFDQLKSIVLYSGIGLVFVGLLITFLLIRSIVKPVLNLRNVLVSLGRGVFPETDIYAANDEVGDMSQALNSLVLGLKRTTDFSNEVAEGRFDVAYQPLSEEDELGHALVKMRDELGQRERVLEQKVNERTEELVRQKDEVEKQSRKIVELYNNLNDSIRYAKRLQDSILPPADRIQALLPESFIFFRPRDIVSGDFYWFDSVDGKVVFAAVDCTGHGVPGAFMSLIGHNALNQVVKEQENVRPSVVLKKLNDISFSALHKYRDNSLVRDGMDMALCTLDSERNLLSFAGANCPLYIVRGEELLQFKPDKMPIGGFDLKDTTFTDHHVEVQKGDMVYIFSDGYPDQFGGEKGKKFMYGKFRELLRSVSKLPMHEQKEALQEALLSWKGQREQVDDILVIGTRI